MRLPRLSPLLIFFCVGVAKGQQAITQCPDNTWIQWQKFCYLFVNNTQVSWVQAGEECKARQAHRIRIETADEYTFVKKALLISPSPAYWTDLNDLPMNEPPDTPGGTGLFMWGNDEFPDATIVNPNWDKEPDNTDWEDCVHISTQGELSIEPCGNMHAYICEIDAKNSNCPSNWYPGPMATKCFFISNSSDWQQLKTWQQARKICESMTPWPGDTTTKAYMMRIDAPIIMTYMQQNLPYYGIKSPRQPFWTALNDLGTEGTFQWAGLDQTVYLNNIGWLHWRQEPNNLGGHENCAIIQPHGKFSDAECADNFNYACRLALPDAPQEWNEGCGQWSRAGQKCVSVYNNPRLSWNDARQFCLQQGGDLMKFDNEDDTMWMQMIGITQMTTLASYWIGLNDKAEENTFRWADGSWAQGYLLNWDAEPNNWRRQDNTNLGLDQDCAFMGLPGDFSDRHCSLEHAGSICEEVTTICKMGWQQYNGHCYLFDPHWRTHDEAQDNCKSSSASGQGRLFALSSQDEKTWITKQIQAMKQADSSVPYYWWSNLEDTALEGQWVWMDADEQDPVQVQKLVTWEQEPNNWGGNEDCVAVNTNGALNDMVCDTKTGFLCFRYVSGSGASSVTFGPFTLLLGVLASLLKTRL